MSRLGTLRRRWWDVALEDFCKPVEVNFVLRGVFLQVVGKISEYFDLIRSITHPKVCMITTFRFVLSTVLMRKQLS